MKCLEIIFTLKTITMNELKPCPFCGGEAEINDVVVPNLKILLETKKEINYYCSCTQCGCEGGWFVAKYDAITHWNTRSAISRDITTEQIVEAVMEEMANNQCKISSWSSHDFEWMAISSDSAKRLLTNAINKIINP
jgi:Lar family restriction alleviation protein